MSSENEIKDGETALSESDLWIEEVLSKYTFEADEVEIARRLLKNAPPVEIMLQEKIQISGVPTERVKSSVAGASSADFHRYKQIRRDAMARDRELDQEFETQVKNLAFLQRRAAAESELKAKTAKRAAKRKKQKAKKVKKMRTT